MSTVADDLKGARERLGLSVHDIAARTRISRMFLEAIEKGDYDSLPGEVFVVGFLRTFAKQVGLDDNEIVARYKQERGAAAEPAGNDANVPPGEAGSAGESAGGEDTSLMRMLAVVLVILIVAGAYLVIYTGEESRPIEKKEPAKATRPAEATVKPVPAVSEEKQLPNITTSSKTPEPGPAIEAAPGAATEPSYPVELVIKATAESWFAYEADSSGYNDAGILMPGDEIRVHAREEVLLDTGNAGGIEVTYNGRSLGPLGSSGMVRKNVLYTPDKAGARGRPRTPRPSSIPPIRPADSKPLQPATGTP